MARIYEKAVFGDKIVPIDDAKLSVASSAILYGLSVYTVFPICLTKQGPAAFRLQDHFKRLLESARIIGIDTFAKEWDYHRFLKTVRKLVKASTFSEDIFARATIHVSELVPGTRSRGLETKLSIFLYEAKPIVPQRGARLKTSVWRRVPDYAIPSRAKVNGAYVNSVLGKQDALDSGYDDCVFLDVHGHVCEASAANIFLVRNGVLCTPDTACDLLEGINRKTIIMLAHEYGIPVEERAVDLTELNVADEIFLCGTSSFIASVKEIDARVIEKGPITKRFRDAHYALLHGGSPIHQNLLTFL